MTYDFDIVYKKGSENKADDALSKMSSHELFCLALSSVSLDLNQQILRSYENDVGIKKIIQELQ